MNYYRPEWTCGRFHKESSNALMYNLLTGMVFLFQEESAELIAEVINTKKNTKIDLVNISKNTGFLIKDIKEFFNGELLGQGLILNNKITIEEKKTIKKELIDSKKQFPAEKTELNSNSYIFDDAQDDYRSVLQLYNIPFNIAIELTYNCNEQCIHCYNPGAVRNKNEINNRKTKELTTNNYKKLIKELKELGVVRVLLTGGDPFMRKDIWKIIELLYENDFAIDIKTNGLGLLGKEELLAQFYPLEVSLSVYSGIDDTHDRITNVKGSLQKTIKCIENLYNLGINTKINSIIMKLNAKDYFTASIIAKKFAIRIDYDLKLSNAFDGDISVTKNLQVTDELLEIILRDKRLALYVSNNDSIKYKKNSEDFVCVAGINMFGINPKGDVMPCHAFPMILGNILNNPINEIINSENAINWQRRSSFKYFEYCSKKEYCNYCNFCVGDNFIDNNSIDDPNKIGCYIAKTRMKIHNELKLGKDPLNGLTIEERLNEINPPINDNFSKEIINVR
ncbi:MAG: radical SAM protein [Bacteroidetes bacterium]|nr:radical SAM protein [Bacteroidota bacterium]